MLNFLSDVFEFEVNENDFLVFHQGLFFKIEEIKSDFRDRLNATVAFSFRVKEIADIDEIVSKYNFFKYRRGDFELTNNSEIINKIDNSDSTILEIRDIDHRPWRFEFKKAI